MKTGKMISEGLNYSAVTVGKLANLSDYNFVFAPGVEIPGKVFLGKELKASGAEISFQIFEPKGGVSFLHTHKTHEELFIFVKGSGEFQVDGEVFAISEGSVVRVAPNGKRSLHNTGNEPLIMICIQYKVDSFDATDAADGDLLSEKVIW